MQRHWLVPVAATLLVLAGEVAARADDRIFVLTNGRRIRGEVLSEDSQEYVIVSGGGELHLRKDAVAEIDSVVDTSQDPFGPDQATLKPPTSSDTHTPATGQATTHETTPANPGTATPGGTGVAPTVTSTVPVVAAASWTEVQSAKALLARLPDETTVDDALAKLPRSVVSLPQWVGVLALPDNEEGLSSSQRVLAATVVQKAGPEARPVLAATVAESDVKTPLGGLIFSAIQSCGDDEQGSIEVALDARLAALLQRQQGAVDGLLAVLGKIGTGRSIPDLVKALATVPVDTCSKVADACDAILKRMEDPDTALGPIAKDVDVHMEVARLAIFVEILGHSRGATIGKLVEIAAAVDLGASRLDPSNGDDAPRLAEIQSCLSKTVQSLVAMGTPEAMNAIFGWYETCRDPGRRALAISAFGAVGNRSTIVVHALLAEMKKRPVEERDSFANALATLTGDESSHNLRNSDPEEWQRYLDGH